MTNNSMFELAERINSLNQETVHQTLTVFKPEVDDIICNKITDKQRIETALDRLLDVAFDEDILSLYKKLCRYYFLVDQEATISYIQSYREMWDEESLQEVIDGE
jgi:hypothetical protein